MNTIRMMYGLLALGAAIAAATPSAADRFSQISAPPGGAPRIRALVVSGGGYHDYAYQAKALMDAVGRRLPVDWTLVKEGDGTLTKYVLFNNPDWANGFDLVVHNECSADVTDEAFIRRITEAHRVRQVPGLVIHCAMHTYRAATTDAWREFLGVTTRRHTQPHRISVKLAKPDHPILQGFKADWVTPVDELYVIEKLWPNAQALASAVSPEDGHDYPLAWVNDYGGARIFGTTLGHGNDTWADTTYQDLLLRAVKWALKR
jgi:type 1 glutamine amidotransferase